MATNLACLAAFDLKEPALTPHVERLLAADLFDEGMCSPEDVWEALAGRDKYPQRRRPSIGPKVWEHVKWWAWFKPKPARVGRPSKLKLKLGRNDPCRCGSGKKFKKCCGA